MQAINLSNVNVAGSYSQNRFLSAEQPVNRQKHLDTLFTISGFIVLLGFSICLFTAFIPFSTSLIHKSEISGQTIMQTIHSQQADFALQEYISSVDSELAADPDMLSGVIDNIKKRTVFNKRVSDRSVIKVKNVALFTDETNGKHGIQTSYEVMGKTFTSKSYFLTFGALPVTSQF